METSDVLVPAVHDLFWKRPGDRGGWLYVGPIVAPTEKSLLPRRDMELEIVALFHVVPDQLSQLWVFRRGKFEPQTVPEHLCYLPLRHAGLVYEECVNRAKNYLVDRLFPSLRPEQRRNITWEWSLDDDSWVISASRANTMAPNPKNWCFGDHSGNHTTYVPGLSSQRDDLVALAAAIKATDAAR